MVSFDQRAPVDVATAAELCRASVQQPELFFPDQDITPDQHPVAFGAPFGGYKASGNERAHGAHGLAALDLKTASPMGCAPAQPESATHIQENRI